MNKKNLPLILGGVVFLLAAAGLGYLAFAQFTRFDEGFERMEAANAKLAKLVNRKPFPSAANVKALEEQTKDFGAYLQDLTGRMREGQIEPTALNFSQFSGAFEEMRTRLASAAGEHGVQIPPQFDYGFKYYADGNMPVPDDMNRLVRQLDTVEMLSKVLYDAGIKSIVSVERPVFEAAALAAAQNKGDEGRRRRRGDDDGNAATNAAASTEYADPDGLFTREHYVFRFTADDEALLGALAALSSCKPVTVVTKVTSENKARPQQLSVPAAGASGEKDATGQNPAEPLPRELRVIAGKETPAVAVELDVYRFPEAAEGDGTEEAEVR
ncbi:MAG: Amuc_1100 family pilus-like protein [Kiritimatiellae bacterium]|nr:Amuc_1100 family pilus-like protein [Kiritimatiellia bacterium]